MAKVTALDDEEVRQRAEQRYEEDDVEPEVVHLLTVSVDQHPDREGPLKRGEQGVRIEEFHARLAATGHALLRPD